MMDKLYLSEGSSCLLVKYKNQGEEDLLLNYLQQNVFCIKLRGPIGMENHICNWYWININNLIYCIGKPGVKYAEPIGKHAITVSEFIMIYDVYKKYKGLNSLEMN